MAQVQPYVNVVLDPRIPVQEVCAVISALSAYHPGHETQILQGVIEAANKRIDALKGADKDAKPVLRT